MTNPLLEEHTLPPFKHIELEHIEPAVDHGIAHVFSVLKEQLALIENGTAPTWDNIAAPFEEASDLLNQSWSPVSHLNGVKNTPELRTVFEACLKKLTEFGTAIDQHEGLYQAYQQLVDSDEFEKLTSSQKAVIEQAIEDFRLSGIALPEDKKVRYGEIRQRLSTLSNQFSNQVLDATQSWFCQFDTAEPLAGLPESALALAQQYAQQKDQAGYVITLDFPSYHSVMSYADDRDLREKTYHAFSTRASLEFDVEGKEQWDNTPVIQETLKLKKEKAELLGFAHHAELSLAKKMAETPEQVIKFLEDLAEKSKPFAEQDIEELKAYAKKIAGIDELQAWDVMYFSEKLRQEKYSVSQEELRPYFPVEKVLSGLFEVVYRLFDITIVEQENADLYHQDVKFYCIQKEDKAIAYFYFDLFAREQKRGGAWMADCRTRRLRKSGLQLPVAYLTCNFTPPVGDTPSLLTHQEVTTLFHEFGHGLHHMLTQMTDAAISGISGVAWDAVELPSQFLENWCWEKAVIPLISSHYQTGEALPESMLNKMLAAKNFQSGLQMIRQLEFALFDFRLHMADGDTVNVQQVLDDVRKQVAVMIPPSFNRFQNSFSHIFAGGYAAGYYSYKWAEVLSADAFSLFEEKGIFDEETGDKFLNTVLANGGSQSAMDLFVAFRGREPKVDALLRHSGLV